VAERGYRGQLADGAFNSCRFSIQANGKAGPWKLQNVCTVTDLKTNERYAFQVRSSGPIDCDVRFELQPINGGTQLTVYGAARLRGLWRLFQPLLARGFRKQTGAELAALKRLMETSSPLTTSLAL
jgi:hypothetical protein